MPDVLTLPAVTVTWTNMPAAHQYFGGQVWPRWQVDTARYSEARLSGTVIGAPVVGALLYVRFRTTDSDGVASAWTSSPLASGNEFQIDVGTIGCKDSGWQLLAPAAIGRCLYFGLFGSGGDGAADPQFGGIALNFR